MEQKEEMKMKMGNMTCVLKELKIVDENMELDLENMLDDVKSMNIRDKWLEDKTIEDIRTCYAVRIFCLIKTILNFCWFCKSKKNLTISSPNIIYQVEGIFL